MPSEYLNALLQRRPELSMDLMQLMTSYILEMQSRYRELATERVEQRICRAMLRLAAQSGQRVEDGIELSLSREDLAEMTGTTLHTVSRVLAEWHRQGLVEAGREHVRLLAAPRIGATRRGFTLARLPPCSSAKTVDRSQTRMRSMNGRCPLSRNHGRPGA